MRTTTPLLSLCLAGVVLCGACSPPAPPAPPAPTASDDLDVHVALHPRDGGGLALRVVVSGPLDQDAPLSLPEVDGIRWDVPSTRDERTTTQRVTT